MSEGYTVPSIICIVEGDGEKTPVRSLVQRSPTVDQASLTEHFDLAMARRSADSFDKCYRDIQALVAQLFA